MHACAYSNNNYYFYPLILFAVDCREPVFNNSRIAVKYTTTLEDSTLTYDCREGFLPRASLIAICYHNGSWVPNPTYHTCNTISNGSAGMNINRAHIIIIYYYGL